eukprot:5833889-Prymnesium_polylepis.1
MALQLSGHLVIRVLFRFEAGRAVQHVQMFLGWCQGGHSRSRLMNCERVRRMSVSHPQQRVIGVAV